MEDPIKRDFESLSRQTFDLVVIGGDMLGWGSDQIRRSSASVPKLEQVERNCAFRNRRVQRP